MLSITAWSVITDCLPLLQIATPAKDDPLNFLTALTFPLPSGFLYSCGIFGLGLIAGSFLNVVVHRLPMMLKQQASTFNLCFPASRCPECKHALSFWENIPLVSWLLLLGQCRHCKLPISVRYPLCELASALLFLGASFLFNTPIILLSALLLTWFLLALSLIDISTYLLPDTLTLPLMWLGLLVNAISGSISLHDALYGAAAGYLSLWCLFWGFRIVCNKEGMGYGDFKLLSALGAWVGWQPLPYLCILAAMLGICYFLARAICLKTSGKLPFGPCLSLAGAVIYISQNNNQFWLMVGFFTDKLAY